MSMLLLSLTVSVVIRLVSSHGFVSMVYIDGQAYDGNIPGGTTNPSIIRQVSSIDPITSVTDPSLNCGMNATLASQVGSASPGSQLWIKWVGSSDGTSNWPHTTGPIMAYMASCGSSSCADYQSESAEWFKVSQYGEIAGTSDWYQGLIAEGAMANVTIPSNIAPGNYLLRSELISLQNAISEGGAEFYPSCTQLSIGGDQDGVAPSGDLVTFPGGYSATDPGIWDPDVYDPGATYTFPGPPVATLVAPGSSTPAANATSTPTTSSYSQPTSTGSSSTSSEGTSSSSTSSSSDSGSCYLQTQNPLRRRRLSRIMRNL